MSKARVAVVASRAPRTSGREHAQAKTRVGVFDFEMQARIEVFKQLKREIASGKVLLLRRTRGGRTLQAQEKIDLLEQRLGLDEMPDERTACVGAAMRWCQMGMEAARRYGPRAAQAARQMASSQWWRNEWAKSVAYWNYWGHQIGSALRGLRPVVHRVDQNHLGHIFRNSDGHVNPMDPGAREQWINVFEQVASNPAFYRADAVQAGIIRQAAANAGVKAYTWTASTAHQIWVTVSKDGFIRNAGANQLGAHR